jgi:predicted porin
VAFLLGVFMKNKLSVFVTLASLAPAMAMADITLYGKANVSLEWVEKGDTSHSALESNSSRVGIKGSEKLNDSVEVIYQFEYEANVDDNDDDALKQRNIFIGVKGDFGQIIGGHIDTPLKNAQNKVDLFNDLRGDIKNYISPNDNRTDNTVMYSSPSASGFVAHLAYIASEDEDRDDGKSLSLTYTSDSLYLALAFDQDVEAENAEALRAIAQYDISAWQLGLLYEQYEAEGADSQDAWMVSALYNLNSKWALKAQYAQSEIAFSYGTGLTTDESESMSIGADYKLSKNVKVYGFYTAITAEDEGVAGDVVDNSYAGIGMDFRF